jgi:gelsolin
LGKGSTQDERGTAAYKTVELDDLLGDLPVQFREVQGHESKEFLGIFGTIKILSGGVDTGFNIVRPTEYTPRLIHINGVNSRFIRVDETKLERASLNDGDVFVLDGGLDIWQWNGRSSSVWEKRKGEEVVQGLMNERNGRPKKTVLQSGDDDAKFWALLGGKGAITAGAPKVELKGPAADKVGVMAAAPDELGESWHPSCIKELYRVDIAAGAAEATFTGVVANGTKILKSHFNTDHVYILDVEDQDHEHHVYVWVGNNTSKSHQKLVCILPCIVSFLYVYHNVTVVI